MTHAQLVEKAVQWLRAYRCGVVLSEQACVSGEMPDAIGWKRANHSVLIECKISRADFLADRDKPFRQEQELGLGCERFYLTSPRLLQLKELPSGWGLLELRQRKVEVVRRSARNLRTPSGLAYEMNLLLASLRRVEIRIEPQTITEFLKWKNRMQQYNGGACPMASNPPRKSKIISWRVVEPPRHHQNRNINVGTTVLSCPVERSSTKVCRRQLSQKPESDAEVRRLTSRAKKKTGLVGPVSMASS